MKLVAVAQGHGGVLEDGLMARVVNGLGGRVGVPRMAGLNDGDGDAAVVAVVSRAGVSRPLVPSRSSATQDQLGGGLEERAAFPLMTAEKARQYQTAFEQLDTANRRVLSGTACFGMFMQSGLSKGTLKDIWDVVAGRSAELNGHQFIQCMYLIDWVKLRGPGAVVPKALPAQFPPGGTLPFDSGMSLGGTGWGQGPAAELQRQMPERAVFASGGVASNPSNPSNPSSAGKAAVAAYTGAAQFASLSVEEQSNLAEQERLAREQEERLELVEQQRKEIAARQEFYTSALADLRIAQSNSSRGLVEAEQRLEMERKACEEMEAQYEAAYEAFNEQHARVGPVLKTLV